MNLYLNAALATEHQQQLLADAAAFRRSRRPRKTNPARRRYHR